MLERERGIPSRATFKASDSEPAPSILHVRLTSLLLLVLLLPAPAGAQWTNGASNPYGELPIRVHVDASNLTEEGRAAYLGEARAALRYWENGGNGDLRWTPVFEEVATPEEARLRFWFVDAGHVGCAGRRAAGCGGFDGPEGGPWGGIAAVAVRAGDGTRYLPYVTVRETSIHEIGHALGLRHSEDANNLMYRHVTSNGFADAPDDTWLQRSPLAVFALVVVVGVSPFLAWKGWRVGARLHGEWRERQAMALAAQARKRGP